MDLPRPLLPRTRGSRQDSPARFISLLGVVLILLVAIAVVCLHSPHFRTMRINFATCWGLGAAVDHAVPIRVAANGLYYYQGEPVSAADLRARLRQLHAASPDAKVTVTAEASARHGDVMQAFDFTRAAGIYKVGYVISKEPVGIAPQ